MKQEYAFFGQLCDIAGVVALKRIGQLVQLNEELARDVALGGGAILPADRFAAIFGTHGDVDLVLLNPDTRAAAISKAVEAQRAWIQEITAPGGADGQEGN